MVALQSSQTLDLSKLIYFGIAAVASGWAAYAVLRRGGQALVVGRPWLLLSALALLIVGVSLPVALASGIPLDDWLRDSAAYLLFAAVPWLALDVSATTSPRALTVLLGVAGALSVMSFSVEWLERRRLADLAIDRLTLPSFFLAVSFFCLMWAIAASSARLRAIPLAAGTVSLALVLLTGTRSTVVLLAAPFAIGALIAWHRNWGRVARHVAVTVGQVLLAAAIVVAWQGATRWATGDGGTADPAQPGTARPPDTTDRIGTIDDVVAGTDNSLRERIAQTQSAIDAFWRSPAVGTGPGYRFEWLNYAGEPRATFTLDSPAVVVGKFGMGGILLLIGLVWVYSRHATSLWRRAAWSSAATATVAYGAVALAWLPLGWPIEDKGFSLALIPLLALGYTFTRSPQEGAALPARTGSASPRCDRITGRSPLEAATGSSAHLVAEQHTSLDRLT